MGATALWPKVDIEPPPEKISQRVSDGGQLLNVMMQEYAAIRGEIQTSLSNQVSILSFGAATVGLLVAAGAALWQDEPWPTGLLLLLVVPVVCFLTLIIYAGELIRLMRAGLFLNRLENCVNEAASTYLAHDSDKRQAVLTWEQWRSIRTGRRDVDRSNRWAITSVFFLLAIVSSGLGYWRLKDAGTSENLIWLLAAFSVIVGGLAMVWVLWLSTYAYQHRDEYIYWADEAGRTGAASATAPPPGEAGAATKDTTDKAHVAGPTDTAHDADPTDTAPSGGAHAKDKAHDTDPTDTAPSGGTGGSARKRGHPPE
jgi:hypothetical protein